MKKLILLINASILSVLAFGQIQHDDSILIRKLQKYSDSTIVLQYRGYMVGPYLQILSKKGDTINCYTYKDIVHKIHPNIVPKSISGEMLGAAYEDYSSTPADLNRFFSVESIQRDSLVAIWKKVSQLNLWKIKDDRTEGAGCPTKPVSIGHGMEMVLLLVTRNDIKELNFYGPDEYERICPGRKSRQAVLKLSSVFKETFLNFRVR